MTKISFRQYFTASVIGSLPNTVTFVVLGDAIAELEGWILFGVLLTVSLGLAFGARYSPWARKHVFKKVEPSMFE
jgi:uncharacterized membrane protein YdjX (TVP38/TMEM64 family)